MSNEVTTISQTEKDALIEKARSMTREEARAFIQGFKPEVVLGEVNRLVYMGQFAMQDVIEASDNYKRLMHYE